MESVGPELAPRVSLHCWRRALKAGSNDQFALCCSGRTSRRRLGWMLHLSRPPSPAGRTEPSITGKNARVKHGYPGDR
jgi:hypothetical protein